MAQVRARRVGAKWRGEYNWGGCWFQVRNCGAIGRVVTFGTAKAAREAAEAKRPKGFTPGAKKAA